MKVAQINAVCGKGSTGKICVEISNMLDKNNIENKIYFTSGDTRFKNGVKYANDFYIKCMAGLSRIFGKNGFNSKSATLKLVKKLKEFDPDIIHLHNLHGHNIDLNVLFTYLGKSNKKVIWTFHDCWAFTSYCPYFTMAKCDKWETSCYKCPQKKGTTWFFDRSKSLFKRKKRLITGVKSLTIITPSEWLADLVKRSFLKDYPVQVINNGIDLSVFKPTENNFRERYNIPAEKYILLGVAFGWGARKGLDVFIELSKRLPDNYQIVLVGTNDKTDKQLPKNIISIHRTQNQTELAEIYTAADLFVNPTREEVLGLVNVESLACGTPVLTFRTGGSPECIDETCGSVVDCDDIDGLENEIKRICEEKPYSKDACLTRAKAFDVNKKFLEYIKTYQNIYDD